MLPEAQIDRLLNALYKKGTLNVYDFCAEEADHNDDMFLYSKAIADELAQEKLAKYTDDKRTELSITNFGRFWMAQGGYLVYLKEGEKKIKSEKDRHQEELKEELKEARLKFTHYRLITYWWGFAFSIFSFLLSLLSLYLILTKNK
jgi:hypothetical protein